MERIHLPNKAIEIKGCLIRQALLIYYENKFISKFNVHKKKVRSTHTMYNTKSVHDCRENYFSLWTHPYASPQLRFTRDHNDFNSKM